MTIEQYYDEIYERSESVSDNEPVTCTSCDGDGSWSDCCGSASMDNGICGACGDACKEVNCDVCKGDGVIDI